MRPSLGIGLVIALIALALPSSTPAQVQLASPHSLDANLRLGSGGYNGYGRAAVAGNRRIHRPWYSVSRPVQTRLDYHNAFLRNRHYDLDRNVPRYGPPAAGAAGSPPPVFLPLESPTSTARGRLPQDAERQMELLSYAVGFYLGREIRGGLELDGVGVDLDRVVTGFDAGIRGAEPAVSRTQLDAILSAVHDQMQARMVEHLLADDPEFRKRSDDNAMRSREFLEAFRSRPGAVTLPGGVTYKATRSGTGATPAPTDAVRVNVRMMLVDGTLIGDWRDTDIRIDQAIAGGAQVLPRMKEGARWIVAIPPELAYGTTGRYPEIGPNEALFADIELLEIK
jgi:FKBP-type peptidyl-prolyl cis-trans isomerase